MSGGRGYEDIRTTYDYVTDILILPRKKDYNDLLIIMVNG